MNTKQILTTVAVLFCSMYTKAQIATPQLRIDNIEEIINSMTTDEKVRLLVGTGMPGVAVGMPVIGATRSLVPGAAGTTYPIPRLGIPAIVLADGPAGLRIDPKRPFDSHTYYCTHFPVGTSLASSWNIELVQQVGKTIGEEVHDYGVDILLAPGSNIQRNPLCGRNFEYYSEDPILSGNISAAYIIGLQENGVGASLKHFAFNNQETKRLGNDARVSQRSAREIYLKAFEIPIKKGRPWTVMTSYNKVNGIYTSENKDLLTTLLRDEWKYEGTVLTDWFAGKNRSANVMAGNDMIQPGLPFDPDSIKAGINDGRISMQMIDRNVRHILHLIVKTHRFEKEVYNNNTDLKAHSTISCNAAAEGMILLKNNGMLPFGNHVKCVAVYGVNSYDILAGGTGSGDVNRAYTVSLIEGLRNNGYTTHPQLLEMYSNYLDNFNKKHVNDSVNWFEGTARPDELVIEMTQIKQQAETANCAIITIGRRSGEDRDRKAEDFYLNDIERKLIENVTTTYHKLGKQVVVMLNIGGVIETASWKDLPDAILLPWQCGQEGGNAMANILSGVQTPSGKLPMTFPINLSDHYSSLNMPQDGIYILPSIGKEDKDENRKNIDYTNYEEDIYVGYRYFDTFQKKVSYPFGYGLSYTTFEYGQPSLKIENDSILLKIEITNTGKIAGKEVVEVYVMAPKGKIEKPYQELKAFAKTRTLLPGEKQQVDLIITKQDLASFNEKQHAWITDSGLYSFRFGTSSQDIKQTISTHIDGCKILVNNILQPQVKLQILTQQKKCN